MPPIGKIKKDKRRSLVFRKRDSYVRDWITEHIFVVGSYFTEIMQPLLEIVAPTTYLPHEPSDGRRYSFELTADVMDELWDYRPNVGAMEFGNLEKSYIGQPAPKEHIYTSCVPNVIDQQPTRIDQPDELEISMQSVNCKGQHQHPSSIYFPSAPTLNESLAIESKIHPLPRQFMSPFKVLPAIPRTSSSLGSEISHNDQSLEQFFMKEPAAYFPPVIDRKPTSLPSRSGHRDLSPEEPSNYSQTPNPPHGRGFPTKAIMHRRHRFKGGRQ